MQEIGKQGCKISVNKDAGHPALRQINPIIGNLKSITTKHELKKTYAINEPTS